MEHVSNVSHLQRRKLTLKQQRNYLIPGREKTNSYNDPILDEKQDKTKRRSFIKPPDVNFSMQYGQSMTKTRGQAYESVTFDLVAQKNRRNDKQKRFDKLNKLLTKCFKDKKKYIDSHAVQGRLRYKTENETHSHNKSSERQHTKIRLRTRSNRERSSSRLQRINHYSLHRLQNPSITQAPRYKNQKIGIIAQHYPQLLRKHPQDPTQLQQDLQLLVTQFTLYLENKFQQPQRQQNQEQRTLLGRLLFFVGYEIGVRYEEGQDVEYQAYELVLCNYYQIYYSMKLNLYLVMLQCYLVLMDFALEKLNYRHAQKYAQKCLLASIHYRQKYYQQKSIQKISMCQYYKGNICEATYLHDNNGQVSPQSVRKIRETYNENEEMEILARYLYQMPRFDVGELLGDGDGENGESVRGKGYRDMVVFRSPRIGVDDSMENKKNQLKLDLISMQRSRQFKQGVLIIKKQVKRHENLFRVHRSSEKPTSEFKLVKRSPVVDSENESSQVLRAHQSLNRISNINKEPIRVRLMVEFVEFCRGLLGKVK